MVPRLRDQPGVGPSGVDAQSKARQRAAISPGPGNRTFSLSVSADGVVIGVQLLVRRCLRCLRREQAWNIACYPPQREARYRAYTPLTPKHRKQPAGWVPGGLLSITPYPFSIALVPAITGVVLLVLLVLLICAR